MRATFMTAVLFALAACAAPETIDHNRGWAGAGSSFEYLPSEGTPWSFTIDGSDLHLVFGGQELTLADAVPRTGVLYDIHALDVPDMVFDVSGGYQAHWTAGDLLVADAAYHFADGPAQIRLPAR